MSGQLSRREFLTRKPAPKAPAPVDGAPLLAVLGGACISVQGVSCRLCLDPCEPDAIRFRLLTGGRALPEISAEACTGCGACVSVCPVGALSMAPASSA